MRSRATGKNVGAGRNFELEHTDKKFRGIEATGTVGCSRAERIDQS